MEEKYYGYEVWNRLLGLWPKETVFINGKKKSKKKAIKILKNNVSESSIIVAREVKRKLPFYKGDYNYFRRHNRSGCSSPIYRIKKTKLYIDILD